MKAKGFSPLVQRVCSEFDAALGKMLDDLAFYVSQNCDKGQISVTLNPLDLTAGDDSSAGPFDLAADNGQILAFAQQAVAESFGNMVTSVASKFIDVDAQGKKCLEMFAFVNIQAHFVPFQSQYRELISSWAGFTRPCLTSARTWRRRSLPPRDWGRLQQMILCSAAPYPGPLRPEQIPFGLRRPGS